MSECKRLHIEDILKLNGAKTYLGLAAIAIGFLVQNSFDYGLGQKIVQGGIVLAGIGATHKIQKATKK